MLTQLSIRNIVLIESCDISFGSGLCVLSGETGAGKSILLDALGLVLGARADSRLLRQGQAQGAVTAEFSIADNEGAKAVLAELELDVADDVIIRRTITDDGKTRCLLNDQPVTVAALKRLGECLIEIHGQHDQRSLSDSVLQRDMLDDYAQLGAQRGALATLYRAWRDNARALEALYETIKQTEREKDYLEHISKELAQLSPKAGEEEKLTEKRTHMMQSEKLYELLNESIKSLTEGDSVSSRLRSAHRTLTRSPLTQTAAFEGIIDALDKAATEADLALEQLEHIGDHASYDPDELDQIEERLFELKAAGRKYNLPVEQLAILAAEVKEKLALMSSQEHRVAELKAQEKKSKDAFLEVANALSDKRLKASTKLIKTIHTELAPLKMDNTSFRVRIEKLDEAEWSAAGIDGVYFECATNVSDTKNIPYAPLSKIASGGELSRFMLALKVALAGSRQATTLIFDEIDTGTGGAVADAIGKRLATLGEVAQVLVVTHLPQVAARGSQHLLVSKQKKAKQILTEVVDLSAEARAEELARMLAGETITTEARKAAKKLLEHAA